ncbi:hypothetical protein Pmar_PMAR020069 [Perkinsus marinus ATCC 50983]|uniref:Uncharacterized protein n=1 Tax=Perkinsus marinus (strain ATCC 50983 / TXsc) TaxID=423536 RepID=C5KWL5_PERM5|nr:hypothetical protein Pmar_PMAR020069 [Perkinsus marinus ATCC 50983]EER11090.1 hypothetical protein Pmar_PMAR020069 [Perkinsus marinus ATCC 50983]|eukprot:XP_002779295.1 hypothetical protein Pmar_PMAR020069 [Perkinsus marinus ATCC 50983]
MTVSTGKVSAVSVPLQPLSKREILKQLKRFFISTNTAWSDRKWAEARWGDWHWSSASKEIWRRIRGSIRPNAAPDNVEDMLDRIERLRRDGLFYAALMNLVTARAEWLFVKTGMRHMANGFRMNTAEAYSVEEALYHIPVTFLDNWGQPKDTALKSGQRRKGGTAVRSNPQEVLCIPELHVIPESDRVLQPEGWYFVSQLAEIAMVRWTEPGAEKTAVDEAVLRLVWSLWRLYYTNPIGGEFNDQHDLIISKILATMGFACYRLEEFSLARECFKNAKILRISHNTKRHREPPMICPHVAAWGHNEALALAALGKFRNAYKLAWSAAEIMNATRGPRHPETIHCQLTVERLTRRPDVAMSLSTGVDVSPNEAVRAIKKAEKRPKPVRMNRFFEVKWARNARAAGEIPRGSSDQQESYNGGYVQSLDNALPQNGIFSEPSVSTADAAAVAVHPTRHDSMLDNMDDSSSTGVPPSLIEPALLELVSYDESSRPMMSSEEAQELLRQLENAQQSDMTITATGEDESVSPFELPHAIREPPVLNHYLDITTEAEEAATSQAAAAAAAAALASKREDTSQADLALLMETVFKVGQGVVANSD